jgi:hypothetical protein
MCWLDHPFYLIQNPNFEISDWFPSLYLQLSCLLYLFLLVLQLLAGMGALAAVDARIAESTCGRQWLAKSVVVVWSPWWAAGCSVPSVGQSKWSNRVYSSNVFSHACERACRESRRCDAKLSHARIYAHGRRGLWQVAKNASCLTNCWRLSFCSFAKKNQHANPVQ